MKRGGPIQRKTPLHTYTAIVRKKGLRPKSKKRGRQQRKKGSVAQFHFDRLAEMRCRVGNSDCSGRVTLHHVTASIHGGRITRSDARVVPLCQAHHQIQHGPRISVEALGHGGFYERYGSDLLAVADELWDETMDLWLKAHGLTTADKLEAA